MSWLTSLALMLGGVYVGTEAMMHAIVLLVGRDFYADVYWGRWGARAIAAVLALLAGLLLAASVDVAIHWPALAAFPALGALWVIADLVPMVKIGFGSGFADRMRTVSKLSTVGGFVLLAGLLLTLLERRAST